MKITLLSEIDYAGSGHRLSEALRRHTSHDIQIFTGKYYNPYGHPQNTLKSRREAQRRVDSSDIVHLKGDFPPKDGYLGLKIMHKPIVITVSGSHFRKKAFGGHGKYNALQYKCAVIRTSFEPDLLYPEYGEVWTPHPIDSTSKKRTWQKPEQPLLMHMATNEEAKDTGFIRKVFDKLRARNNLQTFIPVPMSFEKAVSLRKGATIYFDQFRVGFYGNSALEAMQYGIPVGCFISKMATHQGFNYDHPIITAPKEVNLWVAKIEMLLDTDMEELSRKTKEWCDERHGYPAIAKQWNELYDSI